MAVDDTDSDEVSNGNFTKWLDKLKRLRLQRTVKEFVQCNTPLSLRYTFTITTRIVDAGASEKTYICHPDPQSLKFGYHTVA